MLVIGCGNRDRGDDGAGVMVAERVRKLGVQAEICTGESLALIEAWNGADDVVLVDAVVTGAPVGKVWLWDGGLVTTQGSMPISTHGFGVAEAIKLARILGPASEAPAGIRDRRKAFRFWKQNFGGSNVRGGRSGRANHSGSSLRFRSGLKFMRLLPKLG